MGDILLLQNIISRIAHGLIGLDLYQQEEETNQYLDDFLSIQTKEITEALTTTAPWHLEPNGVEISVVDFATVSHKIESAKEDVRNLTRLCARASPEELEDTIKKMRESMALFYGAYGK